MKRITKVIIGVFLSMLLGFGTAIAAEITIGLKLEPSAIDPHYHNLTPNNSMARHIFDRLMHTNEKQQLEPGLAVSWKPINDTTWELKLRKGVKWHDGTPFTADDVLFTWERAPNVEKSPSSFNLYIKLKTLKKIDDHTIPLIPPKP